MRRAYLNSLKAWLILSLSFFSLSSFADSYHQFSLDLVRGQVDYPQGEAVYHYIGGTAYFSSVKKTDALPYARTAFYSRTGNVSLSASEIEWNDFNTVVGGRVFNRGDAKNYTVSTFLAHKDTPVWAKLIYRYLDSSTWYYTNGTRSVSEDDSVKEIVAGVYLLDDFSVHALFSKLDDKTYGLGLNKLFNLSEFGFVEVNLGLSITKRKDETLNIVNNVVRNLDVSAQTEKNAFIRMSYFPFPATQISLLYQQVDYDQFDWEDRYQSVSIQQYFMDFMNVTLSYTHKDSDSFYGVFSEYNDIGLRLGLDF